MKDDELIAALEKPHDPLHLWPITRPDRRCDRTVLCNEHRRAVAGDCVQAVE